MWESKDNALDATYNADHIWFDGIGVRVCANCCGIVSALESSLKERALSIKGRQQRGLSVPLFS
jgi:hypothetical protein